jgi:hypothetical protein
MEIQVRLRDTYLALEKRCQVSGVRVDKLEALKPENHKYRVTAIFSAN